MRFGCGDHGAEARAAAADDEQVVLEPVRHVSSRLVRAVGRQRYPISFMALPGRRR